MDDSVIDSHLSGRIVAGVYPLIEGERCCFLACDFDKGSWLLDALAFIEVCSDAGVPACLERSRSGNGAHVWIFFDGPVEGAVARRLGTGLLRETMAVRAEIDLTSYDRLFPSQDFVPQKGFGNLIALPLQGRSRKHGNAVFSTQRLVSPGLISGHSWPLYGDCQLLKPETSATGCGWPPVRVRPERAPSRARHGPDHLRLLWSLPGLKRCWQSTGSDFPPHSLHLSSTSLR